jgi:hypothetical protein
VYARARDLETLRAAFRFLFPGSRVGPGGGVPQLEFKTYDPGSAFEPVKGVCRFSCRKKCRQCCGWGAHSNYRVSLIARLKL